MEKGKKYTTTVGERLSLGLFSFGTILSYYMIMSYLQLYMTDIGIAAVTVGIIFIVAKVWDAVNDPIFGVIVDKVKFKKGKYKPWLKIATMAIPVTTILLFIIPAGVSLQVKIIWSTAAYVLWDTSYTMCDVPMNSLVTSMTEELKERNKLYSIIAFAVYLGGLLVAVIVPMLFPTIGWGATAILLGVLCLFAMIPINIKGKERFLGTAEKESTVKEILMSLIHNKYLLIFTLSTVIGGITNLAMSMNGYFAIHCLGSEVWITPLSLATAVPILLVVLFVPKLLELVDKFTATLVTRIMTLVIDIIIFFVGYHNIVLLLVLIAIKNIFFSVWSITSIVFIADCVEYGQYHTGDRTQGIAFSTKAFTNKIIVALTGSLAMFGLAAVGFIEGAGAVQSQATVDGIWFLYSFLPIVGNAVSLVIFTLFFKLRDKDVQAMARFNNGEISRKEAEASFSRKY